MAAGARRLSPWLGTEVMFLLLVAAALLLLEVGRAWSIVVIFGTWGLVALVELAAGRRRAPLVVVAEPDEPEEPEVVRTPFPPAAAVARAPDRPASPEESAPERDPAPDPDALRPAVADAHPEPAGRPSDPAPVPEEPSRPEPEREWRPWRLEQRDAHAEDASVDGEEVRP